MAEQDSELENLIESMRSGVPIRTKDPAVEM